MTPRLLASLIWMLIVLIPPLRLIFVGVALALWPTIEPFRTLGRIDSTWVPFVILLIIGYLITLLVLRVVRADRIQLAGGREHGGDRLSGLAMVITIVWLALNLLTGALGMPAVLIGALIIAGMAKPHLPEPIPSPTPGPPGPGPFPTPSPTPGPLPSPPDGEEQDWEGDTNDGDSHYRTFSWLFNEEPYLKSGKTHRFGMKLKIPRAIYDGFKSRSHDVTSDSDYIRFANEELNDEVVSPISGKLRSLVVENGFDALGEIHLTMAFALCIPYASDDQEYDGEYPKYPVETLVDNRGDCEDHAILCGVLLHRLGHLAALALTKTHAFLGVEAPVPVPGASVYVSEIGAELFACEATPGARTTETTTAVQFWLGKLPHSGTAPARFWRIG